jgi:type VI protein secretion system component VasA
LVDGISHLRDEHFLLGCTPATNEYVSRIEPLRETLGMTRWPLKVAGRPHAEVLHVNELGRISAHDALRRDPIFSWESPASPHRFGAGDVYFLLEQSIAIGESRTETRVSFASLEGFDRPLPGLAIDGEVLASDGALTSALGLADVGRGQGAVNVTRVAPSRRASVGVNHAWRMNAYARMPPSRFVTQSYLHEFFKLHDTSDVHDEHARIQVPRFTKADHVREHRLSEGMIEWGDVFTVDLDAPNATEGEAWILSELLSRAIAERNERLRFSSLRVTRESAGFADFSPRQGARLPFPLG